MKIRFWTGALMVAASCYGLSGHAAILKFDSGLLIGADDVSVGGNSYQIRLVDGTCASLYNGCDELSDLPFSTKEDADAASQALIDQIFVDENGDIDLVPSLTFGCELEGVNCRMFTPWGLFGPNGVNISLANNTPGLDAVLGTTVTTDTLSKELENRVFVAWRLTPATVAEPATSAALGAMLIGLMMAARPRRRSRLTL